jgi:hypothetical protein
MLLNPYRFGGGGGGGGSDPHFANVVLLLDCNGNAIDRSSYGRTVTASGTGLSYQSGLVDTQCLQSTNLGGYWQTADANELDFGTGDFTVEFFVRFASLSTSRFLINKDNNATASNRWILGVDSGDSSKLSIAFEGSTVIASRTPAGTLAINTTYHVAWSRTSSTSKLFVGGVQKSSWADSSNYGGTPALRICDNGSGNGLNGKIGPVRVTKGVGRYTADFTPPSGPFPTS